MAAAEQVLDADTLTPQARELRARVFELAEGLYQSIRMQLSVPRYQAIGVRRGANLDGIDYALNSRVWLKARFAEIRALTAEPERLAKLDEIVNWTNPGPGGFYDDLGNTTQQPHLLRGEGFEKDPDFLHSSLVGFGVRTPQDGWKVSWFTDAETLFDAPLQMRYTDLDPGSTYKVRVIYAGDSPRAKMKLVANGNTVIHDYMEKPSPIAPVEFMIPPAATKDGTLQLEWTRPPGLGGTGRGCQVAEVWLMRVTK